MKICSLDTEVTATAPHQVAICALRVLHHCKNQTDQTFELSVLLNQRAAAFVFLGLAGRHGFPSYSNRITQAYFLYFRKTVERKTISSPPPHLCVSGDSINLALA